VLDGGVILLLAIEGLMRRDLSLQVKERIVQVGFVFLILIAVHGFVIYCVATNRMPVDSWFYRFNYGYFLFFLGWGGIIYLFFMWLVIYREIMGLKWLVTAALTLTIFHLLLSYLDVLVGIRYEFVEALNHHVVHLDHGQDAFYLVALVANLWFVSILWRDVRRLQQFD
jgi:hypothetical protein